MIGDKSSLNMAIRKLSIIKCVKQKIRYERIPTLYYDDDIVIHLAEYLLQSPLVMAGDFVVTLELPLVPW